MDSGEKRKQNRRSWCSRQGGKNDKKLKEKGSQKDGEKQNDNNNQQKQNGRQDTNGNKNGATGVGTISPPGGPNAYRGGQGGYSYQNRFNNNGYRNNQWRYNNGGFENIGWRQNFDFLAKPWQGLAKGVQRGAQYFWHGMRLPGGYAVQCHTCKQNHNSKYCPYRDDQTFFEQRYGNFENFSGGMTGSATRGGYRLGQQGSAPISQSPQIEINATIRK